MPTIEKCINCTEKCPQAELAHQIALGRMYATNELLALVRKIDSGQLVEVVRCKDCEWLHDGKDFYCCTKHTGMVKITPDSFCSYGERRRTND